MNIDELIERLKLERERIGNADVEVRNVAGEFDIAETVEIVNVARERGMVAWRIFIDV